MLIITESVCHVSTCQKASCKESGACARAQSRKDMTVDPTTESLKAENKLLRRLLAVHTCGASLYTDDGELSDASVFPFIDFKRDTAEEIEKNLRKRDLDRYQAALAAQQAT